MRQTHAFARTFAVVALLGASAASFMVGCQASLSAGGSTTTPTTEAPPAPPPPPAPAPPPPPPSDKDGDGIVDADDACPDTTGVTNADKAKNGCPAAPPAPGGGLATLEGLELKISSKIMFEVGKFNIKAESDALLDAIAAVINATPNVNLIEVSGHADTTGNPKDNLKLTDERAKAVVDALVKRKVDPKRLRSRGYGQYCPIDPGTTEEAKEKNRRVQFMVLKMDGKRTTAEVGCEQAKKNGVKPLPVF